MFVPQQRDFGLDPAFTGEASQTLRAHDPVAGDDDRYRVCATHLPDRLGREARGLADISIRDCVPVRCGADLREDDLERVRTCGGEGQIELSERALVISGKLREGLTQERRVVKGGGGFPVQRSDGVVFGDDGEEPELSVDGSAVSHRCFIQTIGRAAPARPPAGAFVPAQSGTALYIRSPKLHYPPKSAGVIPASTSASLSRLHTPGKAWVPTSGKIFQLRWHF